MSDVMTFPATFEEFAKTYKIVDSEQIYTNGTELIPVFRVKQWLEHKSTLNLTDKDKDIIKALEYCVCNLYKCPECPYNTETVSKCSVKLKFDTIDLINRQKGYIDGQKEELDYLRNIVKQKDMTIKICEGIINNKEAELDKHKKHLNRNIVVVGSRGCGKSLYQMNQIESTINTIKAEAIKEFAEKCKTELRTGEIIMDKSIRDIIDNLVKEMVGDTE